eukprot:7174355-Pyramimonas_sp.AAC.1
MGRELDYEGQSILLTTTSGGFWTEARLHHAGYDTSAAGICVRCGEKMETPYHRFWECPMNEFIIIPTGVISHCFISTD